MTVCIAAPCVLDKKPAIVMCCDWQGTSDFLKSDDVDKFRSVGNASCMISGVLTDADELFGECQEAIEDFSREATPGSFDLDMNKYLGKLREAARRCKAAKVRHHVEMSLGMPLEDFWKSGKDYLAIHQHDQLYNEIRDIHLNANLIIGMVAAGESVITKVDTRGLVTWENSSTTIGSGGLIAQAFLHQYDWDEEIELSSCLFRVLSAKHASEKDPYVGPTTSFEILTETGRYDVTDKAWEKLKRVTKVRRDPHLTITGTDLEIIKDDEHEPESSDDKVG